MTILQATQKSVLICLFIQEIDTSNIQDHIVQFQSNQIGIRKVEASENKDKMIITK